MEEIKRTAHAVNVAAQGLARTAREVFLEIDAMKRAGVIADRAKEIRELEAIVDLQDHVKSLLSQEYGKNLVRLQKLKGDQKYAF